MSNIASFLSYFLNLTPSTLVSELGCRVGILLKRIGIELYSSVYIYIYIYIYRGPWLSGGLECKVLAMPLSNITSLTPQK